MREPCIRGLYVYEHRMENKNHKGPRLLSLGVSFSKVVPLFALRLVPSHIVPHFVPASLARRLASSSGVIV
jgi:hypothetical protein